MRIAAVLLCAIGAFAADDGFAKWWPEFKVSVAKSDAKAIVRGTQFPLPWELGKVRNIATEADFVAHFNTYFTLICIEPSPSRSRFSIPGDQYTITWHARGNEYSLYFRPLGGSFVLLALSEGPP